MKTLGLNFLCVAFMLLDASFVPVNCRGDRHSILRYYDVTKYIKTDEVKEIGDTWAEVVGNMTMEPIRGFIAVREYGIEYKENVKGAESAFYEASKDDFSDNKIVVRLKGLSPSTEYTYRIYVKYDNDALFQGEYKTFKTKDK